jgi:hypothetical protein
MEFEGDSPAPRPTTAPEPVPTQNLHVTPENVVALAAMYRACADLLEPEVRGMKTELRLENPWMYDPISLWAMLRFNTYFVYGESAFATVVEAQLHQHKIVRDALIAIATRYGLTEELNAAGFIKVP